MMCGEIPFAGHPSLGVAAAVARVRGEERVTYTQETGAGLQPIDVEVADGVDRTPRCSRSRPSSGPELDPGRGARRGRAGRRRRAPRAAVPGRLDRRAARARARPRRGRARAALWPDYDRIARLLAPYRRRPLPVRGRPSTPRPAPRARARSPRAPRWARIPPPGSAAGPLCAYLARAHRVPAADVTQGVEMGRASRLDAPDRGRPRAGRRRRRRRRRRQRLPGRLIEAGGRRLHQPAPLPPILRQAARFPGTGERRGLASPSRRGTRRTRRRGSTPAPVRPRRPGTGSRCEPPARFAGPRARSNAAARPRAAVTLDQLRTMSTPRWPAWIVQ